MKKWRFLMKKKGLGAVAVAVMLVCGACISTFALIKAYSPTMIFVEHDKKFQESIATKTIVL